MWLQLETDLLDGPRWLVMSLPARLWYIAMVAEALRAESGDLIRAEWMSTKAMRAKLAMHPDEYPDVTAEGLLEELAGPATHLIDVDETTIRIHGFEARYGHAIEKRKKEAARKRAQRHRSDSPAAPTPALPARNGGMTALSAGRPRDMGGTGVGHPQDVRGTSMGHPRDKGGTTPGHPADKADVRGTSAGHAETSGRRPADVRGTLGVDVDVDVDGEVDEKSPPLTCDVSVTGHPPAPDDHAGDALPYLKAPAAGDVNGQTELPLVTAPPEKKTTPTTTAGMAPAGADDNGHDEPATANVEISAKPQRYEDVTELTRDIVRRWTASDDFKNLDDLQRFIAQHDSADPRTLLAHVREIDVNLKVKHKLRALYDRLRGKNVVVPSEGCLKWAKDQINGELGTGGQPSKLSSVYQQTTKPKGNGEERMFEHITSNWPSGLAEEKAREIASRLMEIRPEYVLAHLMEVNSGGTKRGQTCWQALHDRLVSTEKPKDYFLKRVASEIKTYSVLDA